MYPPSWIAPHHWDSLVVGWNTESWKARSAAAQLNRNTLHDGSVSKHTGGSITFSQTRIKLQIKKGGAVNALELFTHTHRKRDNDDASGRGEFITVKARRVADEYRTLTMEKYGEDLSAHPIIDENIWHTVAGPVTKGRLFGFGMVTDPSMTLTGSSSSTSTGFQSAEVDDLKSQMEELKTQHEAQRVALEAQLQAQQQEREAREAELQASNAELQAKLQAQQAERETVESDLRSQLASQQGQLRKLFDMMAMIQKTPQQPPS